MMKIAIHQPHYISPVMLRYVKHPAICGALSQITAAHLPFWDGSVKCMQSMLFVKPPGFQGQAWHQDEIYIPTRDRSLIGAWIAIRGTIDPPALLLGGIVLPGAVSVAGVQQLFDSEGRCLDAGVEKRIRSVVTHLMDYIHGNICPRVALEQIVRGTARAA